MQELTQEFIEDIVDQTLSDCKDIIPGLSDFGAHMPSDAVIHKIFRATHTMKALMMWANFPSMLKACVLLENVLFDIREGRVVYSASLAAWMRQAKSAFMHIEESFRALPFEKLAYETINLEEFKDQTVAMAQTQKTTDILPLNILYIEDEEDIRVRMAALLKRVAKKVEVASDGETALGLFRGFGFDVVISDINMPNMHGLKLIEEIKKINKNVHVIITSAHNEEPFRIKAASLGINDYIAKPFVFNDIKIALKKAAHAM